MNKTVAAVYEQGVLRLLEPLQLPEHTRVQVQVMLPSPRNQRDRMRVRQALLDAGLIRPRPPVEPMPLVSEAQLVAASRALAAAGPLSELIIAERDG